MYITCYSRYLKEEAFCKQSSEKKAPFLTNCLIKERLFNLSKRRLLVLKEEIWSKARSCNSNFFQAWNDFLNSSMIFTKKWTKFFAKFLTLQRIAFLPLLMLLLLFKRRRTVVIFITLHEKQLFLLNYQIVQSSAFQPGVRQN